MSSKDVGDAPSKLSNPFSSDKEGFLAFSASTPQGPTSGSGNGRGGNFVPRRGKVNRLNNWERFGEFVAESGQPQQQQHASPHRRGGFNNFSNAAASPRGYNSPRGGPPRGFQGGNQYRGSPGQYRGSPGQFRGGYNNFRGNQQQQQQQQQPHFQQQQQSPGGWNRGGFTPRGRGGQNFNSSQSYFHPSMLENPWSNLMAGQDNKKFRLGQNQNRNTCSDVINSSSSNILNDSNLSDSLLAQAGCSVLERSEINPAPEVDDYSSADEDEGTVPSPIKDEDPQEVLDENSDDVTGEDETGSTPSASDSMIPMIGDSLLGQDVTSNEALQ